MTETHAELIRTALAANPECQGGLLARDRVVYAEHGCLSYRNDRELFCLVRQVWNPVQDFFYGHVLRIPLEPDYEPEYPGGAWAALLANSDIVIDGETAADVLANVKAWFWESGRYEPCCYVQEKDDAFKLCGSFEAACDALAEMIRRFALKLRAVVLETEEDERRFYRREFPVPGKLDMRSMDIYALGKPGGLHPERDDFIRSFY